MPVYIIRAGETEFVKIGWSRSRPVARMRTQQHGHWEELRLLGLVEGPRGLEKMFHKKFADKRVRGEWFRLAPEMLEIKSIDDIILEKPMRKPRKQPYPRASRLPEFLPELIALWRQTPRLTKPAIARRLRVQPYNVATWTAKLIADGTIASRYNNGPLALTAPQEKKLQRIAALRKRGKTWHEIGVTLGLSRQNVWQFYHGHQPPTE